MPYYLRRLAPGRTVAALGLVEVAEGETDPAAYTARLGGGTTFDFLWFTPVADPRDPCERFAGALERARQRHEMTAE